MTQLQILYPLFAMAALSFYITIRMGKLRVHAVRQDGLKPGYFKHNSGAEPPDYMVRTEQHYVNLFEQPVLFYTVCLITYVTASTNLPGLLLAWLFVGTRCLHTYVHLGSNKLLKRRRAFIFSVVVLITLWTVLFIQLLLK